MKTTLALPEPTKSRSTQHRKRLLATLQQNPQLRYIITHGRHVPAPQPPVSKPDVGFHFEIYGAPRGARLWICAAVWLTPGASLNTCTGWVIASTWEDAKKLFLRKARKGASPATRGAPACINLMPL